MLLETLEVQALPQDGGDDLGQAVVPGVGPGRRRGEGAVGVGVARIVHLRLELLEVGARGDELVRAQGVGQRVHVVKEQTSTPAHQGGRHRGPALDTGEPRQRPEADVDDVEGGSPEGVNGVVDVRAHEGRPVLEAGPPGQGARLVDGGLGEVEARHARAGAGPRQGVEPEVALQVHEVEARHVPEGGGLLGARSPAVGQPPFHVVKLRRDVHRHTLVPDVPILRQFPAVAVTVAVGVHRGDSRAPFKARSAPADT